MGKFCTNCGSPLEENKSKCEYCGKVYGEKTVNTDNSNNTKTNTNANQNYNSVSAPKSRVAAGLLGIFFGSLGVHNFYLGYTGKAIAQLLMTLFSCGLLWFVSWIWSFIEAIMILAGAINTDAHGNKLGN